MGDYNLTEAITEAYEYFATSPYFYLRNNDFYLGFNATTANDGDGNPIVDNFGNPRQFVHVWGIGVEDQFREIGDIQSWGQFIGTTMTFIEEFTGGEFFGENGCILRAPSLNGDLQSDYYQNGNPTGATITVTGYPTGWLNGVGIHVPNVGDGETVEMTVMRENTTLAMGEGVTVFSGLLLAALGIVIALWAYRLVKRALTRQFTDETPTQVEQTNTHGSGVVGDGIRERASQ